jgi:hypothetical protein
VRAAIECREQTGEPDQIDKPGDELEGATRLRDLHDGNANDVDDTNANDLDGTDRNCIA